MLMHRAAILNCYLAVVEVPLSFQPEIQTSADFSGDAVEWELGKSVFRDLMNHTINVIRCYLDNPDSRLHISPRK